MESFEKLVFKVGATLAIPGLFLALVALVFGAPLLVFQFCIGITAIGAAGIWTANLIIMWRD